MGDIVLNVALLHCYVADRQSELRRVGFKALGYVEDRSYSGSQESLISIRIQIRNLDPDAP